MFSRLDEGGALGIHEGKLSLGAYMNKRIFLGLMGSLITSTTTVALAQADAPQPAALPPQGPPAYTPAAPATYPPPPPPMVMTVPAPDPGRHLHDGFYLRTSLGLGPGKATENISTDQFKWSGTGIMIDVMIGGSPAPGFVLGGALVLHEISNPTLTMNGQSYSASGLAGTDVSLDLTTFGLFTAIYPVPTSGFNLHALVGYSEFSLNVGGNTTNVGNPSGPSFMGGLGYDFWISDNWSIGPDFRITYCKGKTDVNGVTNDISMLIPTLSFTATYH